MSVKGLGSGGMGRDQIVLVCFDQICNRKHPLATVTTDGIFIDEPSKTESSTT